MYAVCLLVNWSTSSIRRERLKKTLKELKNCVKVQVDILGSPYGLCGRKATLKSRAHELCESRGGHPELPSLTVLMVSVDVRQHWNMVTASELMTSHP